MIKASISLQDPRRRIYVKAKAESAGRGGVGGGYLQSTAESALSTIGPITLGVKRTRKPSAGNLHAGFDVAGAGNGAMGRIEAPANGESCRKQRLPVPKTTAPVPDPTST
jgi:hypothetical protein